MTPIFQTIFFFKHDLVLSFQFESLSGGGG